VNASIEVPVWLFTLLALLAAWAVLVFFLVPGMRGYFLRRGNEALQEFKARANTRTPDLSLARRRILIDRLVHDTKVREAIEAEMKERNAPRENCEKRVLEYAREIVPSFSPYLYFRIGYRFARRLATFLYRVRLGYIDAQALEKIDPHASIVFVSNHRSNMDYVLVAFLAAERTALSYAVGEWARVWPLHTLIRSLGAYFVRRKSGDPLYRAVLMRYVQFATESGICQAVFPEGGLSRDGNLRAPKMGLIDYMLRSFDPSGERDLIFVPVAVNYDRVLEDRTLLLDLDDTKPAPPRGAWRAMKTGLQFVWRNLRLMLAGRWYRLGYACVNFGAPLSTRAYLAEHESEGDLRRVPEDSRHQAVARFTESLMQRVAHLIPVTPVALIATVFKRAGAQGLSELELKSRTLALIGELEARGAHLYIPRKDQDYMVSAGLRMLRLRRVVDERDGVLKPVESERALLAYYANSIAHMLRAEAGAATGTFEDAVSLNPSPLPLSQRARGDSREN
jgi:glycerol-3-phosphate O-acyltransferase